MTRTMAPLLTRLPLLLVCSVLFLLVGTTSYSSARSGPAGIVRKPIDPAQQKALGFGDRSHWLQPWRAYLDTPPATKLRDAIGINIDNHVRPHEVDALARLLGESGFRRARYEIGWDAIDYADPRRLRDPAPIRRTIAALHARGIRPLILLNANHGVPCPVRQAELRLTAPASQGAREVHLDAVSAAAVVPGRTGFSDLTQRKAAEVIITRVDGGVATLAKPLPRDLHAGEHNGATLLYEPFASPRLADGHNNPAFERTLAGWLSYVATVTREARAIVGSDDFDVEIWNEPSFGSDFLSRNRYYSPNVDGEGGDVEDEILKRTIAFLRNPASGVPGVGIGNGFESQQPWASGATSPAGLTAIDKHPYKNVRRFPQDAVNDGSNIRPLNAFGRTAGVQPANDRGERWRDTFAPRYNALFPEYYLSGIQTEHLIRDLSPISSDVYGTKHGRKTRPVGGAAPKMWITEWNLESADTPIQPAEIAHTRAKAALRFLTAYVNKGADAVHLYAAKHPGYGLVDPGFFEALRRDAGSYPGAQAGGEVMTALGRLARALRGARPIKRKRALKLHRIVDYAGRKQFAGGGTRALPPLYDREVLAFLPFQLDARSFVIPTYVMTRDLARVYRGGSGPRRLDLPPSRYRLTIGGMKRGKRVKVSALDPLTGKSVRVRRVSNRRGKLVVELKLTDSPRLLLVREAGQQQDR